jgi:hypothetical protein
MSTNVLYRNEFNVQQNYWLNQHMINNMVNWVMTPSGLTAVHTQIREYAVRTQTVQGITEHPLFR